MSALNPALSLNLSECQRIYTTQQVDLLVKHVNFIKERVAELRRIMLTSPPGRFLTSGFPEQTRKRQ